MLRAGILISIVLTTTHLSRYDSVVYGANILGVFLTHSPSHLIVHMSVAKVLAEEGHNVTVAVTQEPKVNHQKIHTILIPPAEEHVEFLHKEFSGLTKQKPTLLRTLTNVIGSLRLIIDMQKDALEDERFTQLYDNPDTKFDLVIVGYFLNSFQLGVAAKLNAPVILSWVIAPVQFVSDYVGNPNEIAYVPNMNLALEPGEKMNFLKRLENFLTSIMIGVFKGIIDYRNQRLYKELFTNDAGIRSYRDMKQNVSLVFCNSHFTEGSIRPNVPAVIEIGGIQIKEKPDLLPEDISTFLSKSKVHGTVLFCLGSSLKTEYIKPEITETIFQVLSNLKQNVIWKWDDLTNTPGVSKNIIYKQWIPHDDILAHPNLKLFITHAGKGGVAEAQYHGVPMVALPAFADQPGNAAKMVASGYGIRLDLLTLTDNQLRRAINEVLTNSSYRENRLTQCNVIIGISVIMLRAGILISIVLTTAHLSRYGSAVYGANILGVFLTHSPSHLIVHMSVAKVLAEEGHNVTVVVTQEPKVNHKKIHTIIIPPGEEHIEILHKEFSDLAKEKPSVLRTLRNLIGSLRLLIDMQKDALEDERFTQLYDNPDTKFDLVIVGYFLNSFQLGVAAKFNAPVVLSWMSAPIQIINNYVGNPNGISYVPNTMLAVKLGDKMNFQERVQNFLTATVFDIFRKIMDYRNQRFYNELFPNADGKFPTYQEMKNNVSLVFCNSHFTEGPIRPNVPAIIEIGGIQVKEKPNPLPEDISSFLHESKVHGAILFCLGSNLKSEFIKPEVTKTIFQVLSSLKQNVIWKWDDLTNTPGISKNIIYKQWIPQDDILAHPNLKLFITHAGKGGVAEAQHHGVPMVALPAFADQPGNAAKMVASGYGLQLDLLTLTDNQLRMAINEVLTNPSYKENVRRFSRLYRDRPLTARQSVAFWTNYVIRNHGAAHMQSPLVHMNFIESLNIDVIAFLLILSYFIKINAVEYLK
uniref:UDP-glycosyltransferases domain-containing protein n=1 Tax=Glossina pallidipes TaxID=7398 RepID=A0A1B0A5W2_GLOPL